MQNFEFQRNNVENNTQAYNWMSQNTLVKYIITT